jgi:lipid-A-disaccharide synthase
MNPADRTHPIFLIAGEASGDLHGANLVKALKQRSDAIVFSGIGGMAMQKIGVDIVVDASTLSVVGFTEVFSRLPGILRGMATARTFLKNARPELLILIDFPDFNMKMAEYAKKLGIPILYYISPQIWAWRSGRVRNIGRLVDHIAVILPFEASFYRRHHIPVTFVGHPLLDEFQGPLPSPPPPSKDIAPVIGLLPGSRESEIFRHLPILLQAADILSRQMDIRFILSIAPGAPIEAVQAIAAPFHSRIDLEIDTHSARSVFPRTHLVVAASGTVTLEAAIAGTPIVIIYKVSAVSYALGKILIKVPNIGLVNLIAEREIAPELIQDQATPETIADAVRHLLQNSAARDAMRHAFGNVRYRLGGPGASARVAEIVLNMLSANKTKTSDR